jgi:hypothetical protein
VFAKISASLPDCQRKRLQLTDWCQLLPSRRQPLPLDRKEVTVTVCSSIFVSR